MLTGQYWSQTSFSTNFQCAHLWKMLKPAANRQCLRDMSFWDACQNLCNSNRPKAVYGYPSRGLGHPIVFWQPRQANFRRMISWFGVPWWAILPGNRDAHPGGGGGGIKVRPGGSAVIWRSMITLTPFFRCHAGISRSLSSNIASSWLSTSNCIRMFYPLTSFFSGHSHC
jgi:hypothetical protein